MSEDGDEDVVMDEDLEDDDDDSNKQTRSADGAADASAGRRSGVIGGGGGGGRKSIIGRKSVIGARRRSSGIGFARRRSGIGGNGPAHDSTVSQSKLADMYSNIIKMSSENKINAKNSWSLNLIDHMDHMLLRDDEGGSGSGGAGGSGGRMKVNFQKASCTLDASIKIYSYRVDETYTSSYRVLESLNRSDHARVDDDDGADDDDEDDGEGGGGKKHAAVGATKRSAKMGLANTLEKNPKNINISNLEREFSVDPLFHKMSKTFDEAGSKGMLLCNLSVADGCRVVFDTGDEDDEEEMKNKQRANARLQKEIDAGAAGSASKTRVGAVTEEDSEDDNDNDDDDEREKGTGMSDDDEDVNGKGAAETGKCGGKGGRLGSAGNGEVAAVENAVVDVSALRAKLLSLCGDDYSLSNTPLCPQFQEFRMELKELGEVQHAHDQPNSSEQEKDKGKSKRKAAQEEDEEEANGANLMDVDDDDDNGFGDEGGGGDFRSLDGPGTGGGDDLNMVWGNALAATAGGSSSEGQSSLETDRPSPSGLLDKLCSNVEMVADEYAFFDSSSLAAAAANNWAGVAHWKFAGPKRSKRLQAASTSFAATPTDGNEEDEDGPGKTKSSSSSGGGKKMTPAIDFSAPPPPASRFTRAVSKKPAVSKKKGPTRGGGGAAAAAAADGDKTILTQQYLQRAEVAADGGCYTLPKDMSFKAKDLARLFLRPSAVARRQPAGDKTDDEEGGSGGDGGGASHQQSRMFLDQEGGLQYGAGSVAFVGNGDGGGGIDFDGESGGGGGDDNDDDDFGGGGFVFNGWDNYGSSGGGGGGGRTVSASNARVDKDGVILDDFKGENLLQNRKVEKINISYATKAKRVDVRELKKNLWQCVESGTNATEVTEKAKQAGSTAEIIDDDDNDKEEDSTPPPTVPFSEILSTVSAKEQQEGVTLPFYFICVLHLANEKGLKLEGQDDMLDFKISADPINQASY